MHIFNSYRSKGKLLAKRILRNPSASMVNNARSKGTRRKSLRKKTLTKQSEIEIYNCYDDSYVPDWDVGMLDWDVDVERSGWDVDVLGCNMDVPTNIEDEQGGGDAGDDDVHWDDNNNDNDIPIPVAGSGQAGSGQAFVILATMVATVISSLTSYFSSNFGGRQKPTAIKQTAKRYCEWLMWGYQVVENGGIIPEGARHSINKMFRISVRLFHRHPQLLDRYISHLKDNRLQAPSTILNTLDMVASVYNYIINMLPIKIPREFNTKFIYFLRRLRTMVRRDRKKHK